MFFFRMFGYKQQRIIMVLYYKAVQQRLSGRCNTFIQQKSCFIFSKGAAFNSGRVVGNSIAVKLIKSITAHQFDDCNFWSNDMVCCSFI